MRLFYCLYGYIYCFEAVSSMGVVVATLEGTDTVLSGTDSVGASEEELSEEAPELSIFEELALGSGSGTASLI